MKRWFCILDTLLYRALSLIAFYTRQHASQQPSSPPLPWPWAGEILCFSQHLFIGFYLLVWFPVAFLLFSLISTEYRSYHLELVHLPPNHDESNRRLDCRTLDGIGRHFLSLLEMSITLLPSLITCITSLLASSLYCHHFYSSFHLFFSSVCSDIFMFICVLLCLSSLSCPCE